MIGNDRFVQVFGSVPAGDDEALIQVVSNAVREGFAIVLDKPGTKIPMCILSTRDRKAADVAYQEQARAMGDARWHTRRHDCGLHHALTVASLGGDPSKVRAKVSAIIRRVQKEHGGRMPNIGVEVGRSRLLVIDVDTASEQSGFMADWLKQNNYDGAVPGLTVKSPGVQDIDGEWIHKNGGHYWFAVPDDVELPAGTGVYTAESGWVAMWSGHQVLVPPSSRPEGAYELVGSFGGDAPAWIIERVITATRERMERAARRGDLPDGTGDIDRWAAGLPWADLLVPDGWIDTGLIDRCSCPVFTAPGPHGSHKSATAHDLGCDRYDASPGHAPLHVWTDNPPEWMAEAIRATGGKTFTKIQYVAWRDHDGSMTAALKGLGFNRPPDVLEDWQPDKMPVADPFTDAGPADGSEAPSAADVGIDEPEEDDDSWRRIALDGPDDDDETPPTLMPRTDGAICLLYPGLIHSIHGESESGKSWIIQAEVARVVRDGGTVLFLDFENDHRAVRRRFKALGITPEEMKLIDYRNPDTKPDTSGKWWGGMFNEPRTLIVLDGVTDALGLFSKSTKDNDDISTFLRKFPRTLARRTGAAVVLIDHVVKSTDNRGRWAIGGQAKMAGLDGAAYAVDVVEPLGRGLVGKLKIQVAKDKPGYVRGAASGFDKNRLGDIAVFLMDATGEHVVARLEPPADPFDGSVDELPPAADTALEGLILGVLADGPMSTDQVVKAVHKNRQKVTDELARMEGDGLVEWAPPETGRAKNAKIWTITESGQNKINEDDS